MKSINADATYKLNIFGFPVIIIGSTDKNKSFHPLCIAITTYEKADDYRFVFYCLKIAVENELGLTFQPKILIADASEAITNGFSSIFNYEFTRVYCWAHVVRNIIKKMKELKINEEIRNEIMKDIHILQQSHNISNFKAASILFANKWGKYKNFIDYFMKYWVNSNFGWTAGTAPGYPVTNNALEAVNNTLKSFYTLRQKLIFSEFMEILLKVVADWSSIRNPSSPNYREFAVELKISNDNFKNGVEWKSTKLKLIQNNEKMIYYSPSNLFRPLTANDVKQYEKFEQNSSWIDFTAFRHHMINIWKIVYIESNWHQSTCSCPQFQKNYICKHYVGICMKHKKIQTNLTIENLISPKSIRGRKKQTHIRNSENLNDYPRRRGRPRKVGPALSYDNNNKIYKKKNTK